MNVDLFSPKKFSNQESPNSNFKCIPVHLINSKSTRVSPNFDNLVNKSKFVQTPIVEKYNNLNDNYKQRNEGEKKERSFLSPFPSFHLFTSKVIYARANEKIDFQISHFLQTVKHFNCNDNNNHCDSETCMAKSLLKNLNLLTIDNYSLSFICKDINESWICILPEKILIFAQDNGEVSIQKEIQLEEITGILVDWNERVIYLLGPNAELILKESDETDHFISCLLVANNRRKNQCSKNDEPFEIKRNWINKSVEFLDVNKVPFYKIPSFSHFKHHFSAIHESPIEYFGNVLVSFMDDFIPDFEAEFLMSIEKNGHVFEPIKLNLNERKLRISLLNRRETEFEFMEINVKEIESIHRVEKPKSHSIILMMKTRMVYMAACSEALANDSFDRISHSINRNDSRDEEISHIAITKDFLIILSHSTREIILRALLQSISSLVQVESQLVIEFFADSVEEAEGLVTSEDFKWTLKFQTFTEYQKCLQTITCKY